MLKTCARKPFVDRAVVFLRPFLPKVQFSGLLGSKPFKNKLGRERVIAGCFRQSRKQKYSRKILEYRNVS